MPLACAARHSAPRRVASRREQDIETLQVLHQLGLDRLTPYAHARPHGHTLWSSERQHTSTQGGPLDSRAEPICCPRVDSTRDAAKDVAAFAIQALSVRKLVKGELSAAALRALGATPREVRTLFAWANQQACGIV